jgi:ankyrin repeat protein
MWKYFDSKRGERLRRDLLQCESDEKSVASVRKLLSLTHYEEVCVSERVSERVSGGRLGAVLAAVDVNGWTVLQLAALHGHIETVRTLRDYAVSEGVSEGVSGEESSDAMKCFLAACEHEGVCGMTPLLVAISSGHEALACLLLQAGVSTACTGSRARNCLYLICRANMSEALRHLLTVESIESVCSLAAAPDTSGYNALHACVLVGHVDMCEALLWADVSGDIGRACMSSKSKDDSNVSNYHLVH